MTIITKQSDIAAADTKSLVETYNHLTGKSIKKFSSRGAGEVQVANAILSGQYRAEQAGVPKDSKNGSALPLSATEAATVSAEKAAARGSNGSAKPTKAAKTAAVKTTANGATVRVKPASAKEIAKTVKRAAKGAAKKSAVRKAPGRAKFSEDARITLVVKENPKKGTAADRFALYKDGMTVAKYIAAGGQRRDVVWDLGQGWIKVAE